jgi:hypothetical protein
MRTGRFLVCGGVLLVALSGRAQSRDSFPAPDTLAIYKKIKKAAYHYRLTRFLFHSIFVDPSPPVYDPRPLSDEQKKKDPILQHSGKIIRQVEVEVLDPFGYSVNDTITTRVNYFQRIGNRYHVTTRHRIIRNLLLFKKNDTLELIKITESERLVRSADFVNDAHIYITDAGGPKGDSVDVKVVVQDKWSLNTSGSLGSTSGDINLVENNLFGSGQRYAQYVKYSLSSGWELSGRHTVLNIANTFITSTAFYLSRQTSGYAGFSLDRPFFSALTKWAGGFSASEVWDTYRYSDTLERNVHQVPILYFNSDAWAGRSIRIKANKWVNRKLTNVITAFRYAQTHYSSRPGEAVDSLHVFSNQDLWLASLGFSLNKYYKDQYIFRFGAAEDIPEGLLVQGVAGLQKREFLGERWYAGAELSKGKHLESVGYFSLDAIYGIFFNRNTANDATLNLGLTYFTDLYKTRSRWYFRQFAYLRYVWGINKSPLDRITIRSDELYGFRSGSLNGNVKLMANLETVAYTPYNLVGFRFAPLLLAGFASLSEMNHELLKGCIYQSYALGMLIRNESLVNGSFKITFGFYPNLPPGEGHWYRYNPVTTFTIRIKSFIVSRPELAAYY